MAGIEDVRVAFRDTLRKAIPDLRVYEYEPDGLREPVFMVIEPTETLDYANQALGSENISFFLLATLYIVQMSSEEGWREIDAYRSWTGAKSVRAAVKADNTLGGVVEYAEVVGSSASRRDPESQQSFWEFACTFRVQILQNQ